MKQKSLIFLSAALLLGTLASCGGGMTAEQIQAKAQEKFELEQTELEMAASEDCDANKAAYIEEALQTIQAEQPVAPTEEEVQ